MLAYRHTQGYQLCWVHAIHKINHYPSNYGSQNKKNDNNRWHDTANNPLQLGRKEEKGAGKRGIIIDWTRNTTVLIIVSTLTFRPFDLYTTADFKLTCPLCTYIPALSTLRSIRSISSPCESKRVADVDVPTMFEHQSSNNFVNSFFCSVNIHFHHFLLIFYPYHIH